MKQSQNLIHQVAALPYLGRASDREILLLTSRRTGRLIISKGWTMRRKRSSRAAEIEALQEAGVRGTVSRKPCGYLTYNKQMNGRLVEVRVAVFPLKVQREDRKWKESAMRRRIWMPQLAAAAAVSDPELGNLLRDF